MKIKIGKKEFVLENADKVRRAVDGTLGPRGEMIGGVGKDAKPSDKLAEYDRLGGLITCDGDKVKTGSFYDFKKGVKREKPVITFVFRDLLGEEVEVPEGEEKPRSVVAAEIKAEAKKKKAAKKVAKK